MQLNTVTAFFIAESVCLSESVRLIRVSMYYPSQCALSESVTRRSRRPTRISTRARFPVRGRPRRGFPPPYFTREAAQSAAWRAILCFDDPWKCSECSRTSPPASPSPPPARRP